MSRKLEIRNPKSETMNGKSESENCRFRSFGFVSDFEIRISDLRRP